MKSLFMGVLVMWVIVLSFSAASQTASPHGLRGPTLPRSNLFRTSWCSSSPRFEKRRIFYSPDGTLVAIIVSYYFENTHTTESAVEICSSKLRVLCSKSFLSRDHEHGMKVLIAKWTKDSKYFVFDGTIQGGHQPGHLPTYFYSRDNNEIFSLDRLVGIWVTDHFKFGPDDSVTVMVRKSLIEGGFSDSLIKAVDLNDVLKIK